MPILRNDTAQYPRPAGGPRIRAIELQDGTPSIRGADVAQGLAELGHPPALGERGVTCAPAAVGLVGTLAALLLVSAPAFGVGEVVTDPGAYSHMIEQIRTANNIITEARKQVETLGGIKTIMQDVKSSTEGVYGRGVGILDAVQAVSDNAEDFGSSMKKSTDFSDFSKDKFNKRANPYREISIRTDGIWSDPRSPKFDLWKDSPKRHNAQQQIYKDNLIEAEHTLTEMPKRLDRLGKLSDQIEQTKNVKDVLDLQARFLAELLLIQQQALKMLSHIAQSLAAGQYQGVNPKEAKKAVDAAADTTPPKDALYEHAVKIGVEGISDEERLKRLNNYSRK